ncbi:hypothetical protein MSAN_00173300 [Mycena sanguinolenta]|uniref:Uncharacterized protein n=1 Tax=Mycena sanguinolenta TaxID=230812 RepID=A0A8H6ZHI6_9AGAR|nr:hypothetical protein MSAN_00173300 [Mycena sanguinolenta]
MPLHSSNSFADLPRNVTEYWASTTMQNEDESESLEIQSSPPPRQQLPPRHCRAARAKAKTIHFLQNPTAEDVKNGRCIRTEGKGAQLDRTGRAICRVVYPHVLNYSVIARVFGVGHTIIRRAVKNLYATDDNPEEDYDYVGEDYRRQYPPLVHVQEAPESIFTSPSSVPVRRGKSVTCLKTGKSQIIQTEGPRGSKTDSTASSSSVQAPSCRGHKVTFSKAGQSNIIRHSSGNQTQTQSLASFLQDIGGYDLRPHIETFQAQGVHTLMDLRIIAATGESRRTDVISRLFSTHLTPLQLLMLEYELSAMK